MTPLASPAHDAKVIARALGKVGERWRAFVAGCAGKRRHELIADMFHLSFEEVDALEHHYAAHIAAWPDDPRERAAAGRRVLPPGDRD